jgi:hypothetical protein
VWRYTLALVPTTTTAPRLRKRGYERIYVVARGAVRQTTHTELELLTRIITTCEVPQCRPHNSQFEAIMRSIRFIP